MSDLNDSIDDLLGGEMAGEPRAAINAPADYKPRDFSEPCRKCRGTGRFVGYSGRAIGQCFECKGAGKKTFKTSPETRAKNRDEAATKKQEAGLEALRYFSDAHNDEYRWIMSDVDSFNFAAQMRDAIIKYGDLTERQMASVRKCIAARAANVAERQRRVEAAPVVAIDKIRDAFESAHKAGLKRPKIDLGRFLFKRAPDHGNNAGAIYVMRSGTYLGKVVSGKFLRSFNCTAEEETGIVDAAADPKAAAVAYGKTFGKCSCCGRQLSDPVSIEQGIGPVCANKFGW